MKLHDSWRGKKISENEKATVKKHGLKIILDFNVKAGVWKYICFGKGEQLFAFADGTAWAITLAESVTLAQKWENEAEGHGGDVDQSRRWKRLIASELKKASKQKRPAPQPGKVNGDIKSLFQAVANALQNGDNPTSITLELDLTISDWGNIISAAARNRCTIDKVFPTSSTRLRPACHGNRRPRYTGMRGTGRGSIVKKKGSRKLNTLCPRRGIRGHETDRRTPWAMWDGFRLTDNAMAPTLWAGDYISYEPSDRLPLFNGQIAVVEMKDGKRLVRRFWDNGKTVFLSALNSDYQSQKVLRGKIKAVYPADHITRKLNRSCAK